MLYPERWDEEPSYEVRVSWSTQPPVEEFWKVLKDAERMVTGQHQGGLSAGTQPVPVKPLDVSYRKTYPGDPAEWPRVSDESVMPNSDEARRQRERLIREQEAILNGINPTWVLPVKPAGEVQPILRCGVDYCHEAAVARAAIGTPYCGRHAAPADEWISPKGEVKWVRSTAFTTPKEPDTRCPRVDADTGIQCMHGAGKPHAHETPAGKPIFSGHSGPKLGEYRVAGFGVTLDLPIPPGPIERTLLRAEAALQKNPFNRRNWPKGDVDGTMGLTFAPASSAAAKRRGAGSHLAALHQDTLNRPFYKGRRVPC